MTIPVGLLYEFLIPETAKPLAYANHPFFGKWPVITENIHGKGKLVYIGTYPSQKLLEKIVLQTAKDAGLTTEVNDFVSAPKISRQPMFFSHVEFVSTHPGVPRIMFGELQRAETTAAKEIARKLMQTYRARLSQCIEQGKEQGELRSDLEVEVAVTLFVGIVQGLLVQAMLAGDLEIMRRTAPRVFTIYRRGIQVKP